MPNIPSTVTSTAEGFQPAFARVAQNGDFDCSFACIASITGKPLAEVRELAVNRFKHPAHGPYWITEDLIAGLLAHYGWVTTVYKEVSKLADVPDLAILMVDYDPDKEIGRHVLFHRASASHTPKTTIAYVIDPAYWIETPEHVELTLSRLVRPGISACIPWPRKAPSASRAMG